MSKSGVILSLFPPGRRKSILEDVLSGRVTPERYLLYGLDVLIGSGIPVTTNLEVVEERVVHRFINCLYKPLAKLLMGAHGKLEWLLPIWNELRHSNFIYVFSEKCVYPVLILRWLGVLPRVKTIVISIGIAEKLQALQNRGLSRQYKRLVNEISLISRIITFSNSEEEILREQFGLSNVRFIPFGVDVNYFRPRHDNRTIDVLGIGADKNRDFYTFIQASKQLPFVQFRVITNEYHAKRMKSIGVPPNVKIDIDVSMAQVAYEFSRSKMVYLPVKENTYSGATTCLLQAMASALPVVTNPVAPIRDGYKLQHNKNVLFVPSGDVDAIVPLVTHVLEDDKLRYRIGKSARDLVKNNNSLDIMIESIFGEIKKEYEDCFRIEFSCGPIKMKQKLLP